MLRILKNNACSLVADGIWLYKLWARKDRIIKCNGLNMCNNCKENCKELKKISKIWRKCGKRIKHK